MAEILKFKTIEKAFEWQLKKWFSEGKSFEEIDRFEADRLKTKIYKPGIYKFKTVEEKLNDEIERLFKALENAGR